MCFTLRSFWLRKAACQALNDLYLERTAFPASFDLSAKKNGAYCESRLPLIRQTPLQNFWSVSG
jgi:hypothetical protein